ncbi:hypothetical protein [Aquabacterium sp.]|uniref:hypothetical protein n=1 Tax=Aquabacterium sp. TaxID=1872578 RepID=UPI002489DA10|nr:hypothetical protein [Aquabacterium sp.]MDI1260344.1 hypothetical protein [Aquabacterium sp.]
MNFPTRPHPANVPTLTEVIELDPEGGQLLPTFEVASSTSMVPLASIPHVVPAMPVEVIEPEVSEAQLSQRILTDVQRQIDSMLEFRLRESMQPLLAQFTETLMQDLRDELSRTMRDVVTRAVAQEVAKLRNNR